MYIAAVRLFSIFLQGSEWPLLLSENRIFAGIAERPSSCYDCVGLFLKGCVLFLGKIFLERLDEY